MKYVGSYAFEGCRGLTEIELSDGVTSIGYGAFYGCSGLTSITIPNSVTSIGYEAFAWCSNLKSITIPDSVRNIKSMPLNDKLKVHASKDSYAYNYAVEKKYKVISQK